MNKNSPLCLNLNKRGLYTYSYVFYSGIDIVKAKSAYGW